MTGNKKLYEKINTAKEGVKNFNSEIFEIPKYITENLKHPFFTWQKEAFENLLYYENPIASIKKPPTHLMFNMATGTGKTLLMAATILYYYKQGYKYFLFFVNQNNIIDKTENNFIKSTHNKYLFTENINIDNKTVDINNVNTFSDNIQGIQIKFTSIQKLYNDIHLEKENQTTLDDLHQKNIVMLADEAHHFNANTKNISIQQEIFEKELKGSKDEKEKKGWEHTVIELILNKNGKKENENVLLEFTATIPNNEQVAKKYQDKIIYQFTLKDFLKAGYTKQINLMSFTSEKKERVLYALLFQWYRHKIALKNSIANFKPVILFRSKTIDESKNDYKEFLAWIDKLTNNDLSFLKTAASKIYQSQQSELFESGKSRTQQVLDFIKKENIKYMEIATWIKDSYQEKNIIITNSENNKTKTEKTDEEVEKLLNSLEDKHNNIRAIFTVDRLTEGWDVLNLFDIVRLYEGQNAGGNTKKTPEATIKEKQLIGRGVRYFPFSYNNKIKNKRKFDGDLDNELRILEELFYYTYDEGSKYISHFKAELKKDGYITDDKVTKTFDLKSDFKKGAFYKKTKLWYNEQKDNPERKKKDLNNIKENFYFSYEIQDSEQTEYTGVLDQKLENQNQVIQKTTTQTITKEFKNIEKHIFLKAINIKAKQNSLLQFENLKKELNIKSIDELQTNFLADFKLNIIATKNYEEIENKEKLNIILKFLDEVLKQLKESINPKIGSNFKAGSFDKFFSKSKVKSIDKKKLKDSSIVDNKWYVLDDFVGTSEEINLINFIESTIGNLEEKYQEIYLLKNEEIYKIYDFDTGRGFQPDFLLFLKGKKNNLHYQIFIESKGEHLLKYDKWKEKFLNKITKEYGLKKIIRKENPNYRLIGLPFFNENKKRFNDEFNRVLLPDNLNYV